MALPVGKYFACAVAEESSFGELDNQNRTPFVEVAFRVIEGEHKNETMRQRFFLSEGAAKYTIANLRNAGCVFPGGAIDDLSGLGTKRVEIVVQQQKPRAGETESKYVEIRFVNDPDAASAKGAASLSDRTRMDLRNRLRSQVLEAVGGKVPF